MRPATSTWTIIVFMAISVTLAAMSRGQEDKKGASPAALKKGDEVIALRVAPLQVEAKTIATVRTGDKLVVEEVQGDWLWVRSGDARGWIERTRTEFRGHGQSSGDTIPI